MEARDIRVEYSSFRDPSGFVFYENEIVYRQINSIYKENYLVAKESGLHDELVKNDLLIPHVEVDQLPVSSAGYAVIKPEKIDFISYPYEWSFSQLKDAALTTLAIQKLALRRGMSLKDASAYNIQQHKGKMKLIDTLSFERYRAGTPWIAYRQFCEHFLGPLGLMASVDPRLQLLSQVNVSGIPIDLASRLLPKRTWLNLGMLFHVHLHAASQKKFELDGPKINSDMPRMRDLLPLIKHLEATIQSIQWRRRKTEWAEYYSGTNYDDEGFLAKKNILRGFLRLSSPARVWDIGGNDGRFGAIAAEMGSLTISMDNDVAAVEAGYCQMKDRGSTNHHLVKIDLLNPSPSIGWSLRERKSIYDRGPVDAIIALALIHHLAISNNLPLEKIAQELAVRCSYLIIEFIPKHDSQVQRLLRTRRDIFTQYSQENFELEFQRYFIVLEKKTIPHSYRSVYLMKKK